MPNNQEYFQLREEEETNRKGERDSCFVCGRSGTIGDDIHVFIRVNVGMGRTLTRVLAAHEPCAEEELMSPNNSN